MLDGGLRARDDGLVSDRVRDVASDRHPQPLGFGQDALPGLQLKGVVDLDQVVSGRVLLPNPLGAFLRIARDRAAGPVGIWAVHDGPAAQESGPQPLSCLELLSPVQVQRAAAEVAHRGDAPGWVEHQVPFVPDVDVGVDQPWSEDLSLCEDLGSPNKLRPRLQHRGDVPVTHHHIHGRGLASQPRPHQHQIPRLQLQSLGPTAQQRPEQQHPCIIGLRAPHGGGSEQISEAPSARPATNERAPSDQDPGLRSVGVPEGHSGGPPRRKNDLISGSPPAKPENASEPEIRSGARLRQSRRMRASPKSDRGVPEGHSGGFPPGEKMI